MRVGRWVTKVYYSQAPGKGVTSRITVAKVPSSGSDYIAGTVTVIVHRGGYNQQRAYGKWHVNFGFWYVDQVSRGDIDEVDTPVLGSGISALTVKKFNDDIVVELTGTTDTTGQVHVKFEGPVLM